MADIPDANGPFTEVTKYGIEKAAALEALRCVLAERGFGWISALSEIRTTMIHGKQTCLIQLLTSMDKRCEAQVQVKRDGRKPLYGRWSAEVLYRIDDDECMQVAHCDLRAHKVMVTLK